MSDYHGRLAAHLAAFVAFKQSLGFEYHTEAAMLRQFDRWTQTQPDAGDTLTEALVQRWLTFSPQRGSKTRRRWEGLLRHLSLYLNTKGIPTYIPEPRAPSSHYTFIPHIYTAHELARIFTEADHVPPHRRSTLPQVFPVLLRMLYGCGLRVSEATHLTLADTDWEEHTLNIRHSKFGKDRRLPMSPSLTTICQTYTEAVHPASPGTTFFFCHRDGSPISEDSVYRRFRDVLWLAGIPHRGNGQGPRVHDLRHSFAVHTLKAAVDRGVAMEVVLPVLSAYLGHASLAATEQYVRLTADAFPEIRDQLDRATGWVIPEVAWE